MNRIDEAIQQVLESTGNQYITQREAWLDRRNVKATGELQESLNFRVSSTPGIVSLEIEFAPQGRHIDMRPKNVNQAKGGRELITRLQSWIEKKGLLSKYIAQQERKRKRPRKNPVDENYYLRKLAWGIAITRMKGKYRPRRWYNSSKSAAIFAAYNEAAIAVSKEASNEITEGLKK